MSHREGCALGTEIPLHPGQRPFRERHRDSEEGGRVPVRERKRLAGQRPREGDSAHEGKVENSGREEDRHSEAGRGGGC